MFSILGKREVNKQAIEYGIINTASGLKTNFLAPPYSPSRGEEFIQEPDSSEFVFEKDTTELPRKNCLFSFCLYFHYGCKHNS